MIDFNILYSNLHNHAQNLLCIFVAMLEALFLKRVNKSSQKCKFWHFSSNFDYYLFCNGEIQLLEPARGAAFSSIKKNSAISKVSFLFSDIYGVIWRRSLKSQWSIWILRHSYFYFFQGIRKVWVQIIFPLKLYFRQPPSTWIYRFSFLFGKFDQKFSNFNFLGMSE